MLWATCVLEYHKLTHPHVRKAHLVHLCVHSRPGGISTMSHLPGSRLSTCLRDLPKHLFRKGEGEQCAMEVVPRKPLYFSLTALGAGK